MIIEAILKINPNAIVHVRGSDINTCEMEWLEGTTPISKADIKAKMDEMVNEPEQSNYAQQRRNAYPEIGDQLDLLYKDIVNGTLTSSGEFAKAIKATKDKYPKP